MAATSPLDDHFQRPRNAGLLAGADLSVRAENPVCGDILLLHLKRDAGGRVEASSFQAYGCPAAIAAGSLLSELVRGRSRAEAASLDEAAIAAALGDLGKDRAHAAALAADAVRDAVLRWTP